MNPLVLFAMAITMDTTLLIKSPAFGHNDFIPARYTCSGANINPAIDIGDVPASTKSLALVVDDPDAPRGTFDHWVMWNIAPTYRIEENSAPGKQGKNGWQENKYMGPCPPSGTHHYHIKIYALDTMLDIPDSSDKAALEKAMKGHILAQGELIGLYKK